MCDTGHGCAAAWQARWLCIGRRCGLFRLHEEQKGAKDARVRAHVLSYAAPPWLQHGGNGCSTVHQRIRARARRALPLMRPLCLCESAADAGDMELTGTRAAAPAAAPAADGQATRADERLKEM